MGTGYTRNDTADNIADGNIINASDLDGEFDALQSAFDNSSGHTHDGTAGEGAPVEKVGPNQEVVVTATVLRPAANNTIDLGVETTNEFKDLWLDGTAYLDSVDIDGGTIDGLSILTVDNLSLNGNTITSTDTDGNLNLRANGAGIISVDATDINFGDSDKATFGDGSDLQIYHDGSNSIIEDTSTGNLQLITNGNAIALKTSDGEAMLSAIKDGDVKLYYNNALKLATTDTGISVTGDVQASNDLILASDNSKITFGADGDVEITHSHNVGLIFDNTNTGDGQDFVLTLRSNEDTILADEQIARINFSTNSSAGGQSAGTQASISVDATDTYSATVAGSRMEFHTTTGSGTNTRAMYIDDDQSVVFTGPSANVTLDATNSTLDFPDNFKIMMGAGDDLSIYHDGSNSFISDQGTGNLKILADDFRIRNAADTDSYIFVNSGAEVGLTYNGSTKLETISSGASITGSLGIGTSLPQRVLVLSKDDSTGVQAQFTNSTTGVGASDGFTVGIDGSENAELWNYENTNMVFATNSAERMRINSSGNVGIGTSSVDSLLHLQKSDATAYSASATDGQVGVGPTIYLENPANTNTTVGGQIVFGMRSTEEQARIGATGGTAPALTFGTGDAEAVRIDSDGKFFVGKDTDDQTTPGLAVNGNGLTKIVRSSATADVNDVLQLNRLTSNGDILTFKKDGVSVATIGVNSSDNIYFAGEAGNTAGIYLNNAGLLPADMGGAPVDDHVALGTASNRWSNLYLSGGLYVGGTGSANKLDDYEFGFFEPTYTSNGTNPSGITYDPTVGNEGRYTKIGGLVHIQINIRTDAISNKGTGSLRISGLPFTAGSYSSQGGYATFSCSAAAFLNNQPSAAQVPEGGTYLELLYRSTSDDDVEAVSTSALNTGSNDNLIRIAGTYMTEE